MIVLILLSLTKKAEDDCEHLAIIEKTLGKIPKEMTE